MYSFLSSLLNALFVIVILIASRSSFPSLLYRTFLSLSTLDILGLKIFFFVGAVLGIVGCKRQPWPLNTGCHRTCSAKQPSCDNQTCFQSLLNASWGQITTFRSYQAWIIKTISIKSHPDLIISIPESKQKSKEEGATYQCLR